MIPAPTAPTVLQATITGTIDETIADVIAYLPTLVSALLILLVGYVVGRILGGVVKRVVDSIGISDYTRGTAVEDVSGRGDGDGSDGISRALGKLVAYYVYFVAIVAAANVLDIPQLTETLGDLADYLPVVFGAVVVLVVGFVVGRIVGDLVADVVGGFDIGPRLRDTPLEQFGDQEGEFGRIVGLLVTYYIYLLTLVAVADIIEIAALQDLLDTFAAYLPALVGGLVVLLVGIWVAERVGDMVAESDEGAATSYAGLAVKLLIYYVTITIALAAIGFETFVLASLFTAFAVAFFGAAGLALAIGAGVALGLGAQDYVHDNIGDWMSSARNAARSDGGTDTGPGSHSGTTGGTGPSDRPGSGPGDAGDSDVDDTDFGGSDTDNTGLDDSMTDSGIDDSERDDSGLDD